MMQIALWTILLFIVTECKMIEGAKSKDELEHWKPDVDFIKLLQSTTKTLRNTTKNKNKKKLRHKKPHEATTKWPKVLRNLATKSAARMTKMHMLQGGEETTVINLHELKDFTNYSQHLSAYSIKRQLEDIVEAIPDANVTVSVVGRTKGYLDIVLLKITKDKSKYFRTDNEKYADDKPEKKIIFIVHSLSVMGVRELPCMTWVPSFLTLVSYYVNYLDKFDIFLIPMANPDGLTLLNSHYVWNKNAAPQSECAGVALDRNFDIAWSANHSISSCSQEYPGVKPFTEAESRVIRDVFYKYSHKIVGYLNVHAGTYGSGTFKGDAVLYPKGYTDSITDEDKFIDLKGEIDEAIRNASFQVYSVAVETLYNWYGRVTGSSVDYASTVYGIPFALELVMQLYDNEDVPEDTESYSDSALTEVWSRVIDVIFNYIWKSIDKGNEVW